MKFRIPWFSHAIRINWSKTQFIQHFLVFKWRSSTDEIISCCARKNKKDISIHFTTDVHAHYQWFLEEDSAERSLTPDDAFQTTLQMMEVHWTKEFLDFLSFSIFRMKETENKSWVTSPFSLDLADRDQRMDTDFWMNNESSSGYRGRHRHSLFMEEECIRESIHPPMSFCQPLRILIDPCSLRMIWEIRMGTIGWRRGPKKSFWFW